MNEFVAWQRPAVYALATAPPATARLAADLPITLHDDDGDLPPAPASFLLAGPGDVANLAGGQIIGRRPHPGCIDAEATMMAHVEVADPGPAVALLTAAARGGARGGTPLARPRGRHAC